VTPLPFTVKKKKGKSQTVTSTLPQSQGPEASGSLPQKKKKPKYKKTPIETKVTPPPELTEDSEQCHSVSSGTVPDPQDPERNIQLAGTGLPSTLDEGTRKSQLLPEGAAKTMPLPEGPCGDKDSEGLKPSTDMEPLTNHVVDPSGTDAKYQADQTQSARLSDDEDVLKAGEDMDEDTQADKDEHQSPPNTDRPESSLAQETQESDSDSSSPELKKYDNILPLTERQLAKASIEGYYEENVDHREQTDKLVQTTMDSLDKTATDRTDLLKALNGVTETLKNSTTLTELLALIKNSYFQGLKSSFEFLQATALKQEEHLASWAKSSTSMSWNLSPKMTVVESSQTEIKSKISSLMQDTLEIKSMMIEIYQAFK
ncbi:hypothetical protein Tco_1297071, partial [Tanacetum coccineum]